MKELGWNYRLSDLQCAHGLSQLARLDDFVARRRALAAQYRAQLPAYIRAPAETADRESAYHLFAVAIDFARHGTTRAAVMEALSLVSIGTQVHYIPLLQHPLHAARCPGEVDRHRPGADRYYAQTLSLPMFPAMTDADVTRVVAELTRVLGEPR